MRPRAYKAHLDSHPRSAYRSQKRASAASAASTGQSSNDRTNLGRDHADDDVLRLAPSPRARAIRCSDTRKRARDDFCEALNRGAVWGRLARLGP
jgi:hypothetical protein